MFDSLFAACALFFCCSLALRLKAHHPCVTLNKTCAHLCETNEARGIMGG